MDNEYEDDYDLVNKIYNACDNNVGQIDLDASQYDNNTGQIDLDYNIKLLCVKHKLIKYLDDIFMNVKNNDYSVLLFEKFIMLKFNYIINNKEKNVLENIQKKNTNYNEYLIDYNDIKLLNDLLMFFI